MIDILSLDMISLHLVYQLLYGTLSFILLYQAANIAYNLFFSPLSNIPGPWYAAVSDLWLLSHAARLRKFAALHAQFERYGPMVRVGPNRVIFRNADTVRNVYLAGKLPKSTFYNAFLIDGHGHAMTAFQNAEHKQRRGTFAGHYSLWNMIQFQPDAVDHVSRLVELCSDSDAHLEQLLNAGPSSSVDCIHLLRHTLLDIMRQSLLGLGPTGLRNWASRFQDPICEAVRDFPIRSVLYVAVPTTLWKLLAYVPNSRWQTFYNAENILIRFVKQSLYELRAHADVHSDSRDGDARGPIPLLLRMVREYSASSEALSEQDIVPECVSHLVAGVDTTSSSLGFLLWELSQRPDVVHKLREELDDVIPDRETIPAQPILLKQAYLTAVINEGFRVHGSVSSLLERVVPAPSDAHKSGALTDSFDIMDFALPPGTIVGTQAYSVHRDPDVFPYPDVFDPERWLPCAADRDNNERLARMARSLMPFGAGTRACPSQHQTQLVTRVILAALVLNFDFVADPNETNEKTMKPIDTFVIRPTSLECRLTFRPRTD